MSIVIPGIKEGHTKKCILANKWYMDINGWPTYGTTLRWLIIAFLIGYHILGGVSLEWNIQALYEGVGNTPVESYSLGTKLWLKIGILQ